MDINLKAINLLLAISEYLRPLTVEETNELLGFIEDGLTDSYMEIKQAPSLNKRGHLSPSIEIPANEKWLFNNASGLSKVKKGIGQAKNGLLVDKVSLIEHLNILEEEAQKQFQKWLVDYPELDETLDKDSN